jgi:hypothetical protein
VNRAWTAADRAEEAIAAARDWLAAGLIDERTRDEVVHAHPRSGPSLGWVWRILLFLFVSGGVTALAAGFGVSLALRSPGELAVFLSACGLVLVGATELLLRRFAYAATGAEAATSFLAVCFLIAAVALWADARHLGDPLEMQVGLATAALVLGAAAWRWGFPLYAAAAAASLFLLVGHLPAPRLLWVLLAGAAVWVAARLRGSPWLPPSHARCLEGVRVVAFAAAYLAVNYHATDAGWIGEIARPAGAPRHQPGTAALLVAAVGSAAYPLVLLAWAARTRDRVLLGLGLLAAAASLATLRLYVHVAPLWVVLTVAGALLILASSALERWLRAGPDGERGGFTAAPLAAGGRRGDLLPVAAALSLAPDARPLPGRPDDAGGGGGSFGGGGASGAF